MQISDENSAELKKDITGVVEIVVDTLIEGVVPAVIAPIIESVVDPLIETYVPELEEKVETYLNV